MYKAMNEPENREKILTALTDDYKNEPALFGYYVTDEPNADQFPMLADIVATLKRLDPAHPAYINLFPNYANAAQLGNPTYDAHLRAYMETVKPEILSYDHYHLLTTEQPKEFITFDNEREAGIYAAAQKRTARAGFYDNIEAIRRYGLEFAVPYMLIIGAKEVETNTVSVRDRDTDQTVTMPLDEFLGKLCKEIENRD